jgi:sulfur-oxidizing protein SoxA
MIINKIICFALFFIFSMQISSEEILDKNLYEKPYASNELKSGQFFSRKETRNMEIEEFENPGMIWVERGKELFDKEEGTNSSSCSSCHKQDINSLLGAAATYPKVHKNKLINIEQKINMCRKNYMNVEKYKLESINLLSLSSYIAYISKGVPINVNVEGKAKKYFNKGKKMFYQRVGQMNLACNQCHDEMAGSYLRAERISQGHTNGFPSYLMRWETIASVHRRFQFCNNQARAKPLEIGHDDYNALQLYVAWRGNSLLLESPSVRR